ncbi:hypothetical protein MLD38_030658 [Melastoma candidum]|uniref:Uncharacterized protein n=1 Tax=Melastoma candidum TaxID=119954 RepID=A0ACB9MMF5_9MYRT|nr:hypothetical protein MLD38_030658 [Melastoma candidum]
MEIRLWFKLRRLMKGVLKIKNSSKSSMKEHSSLLATGYRTSEEHEVPHPLEDGSRYPGDIDIKREAQCRLRHREWED